MESNKPSDLEFMEVFPIVFGIKSIPKAEESFETKVPAKPIIDRKDRVKSITKNLRSKYEKERQK